MKDVTVKPAVLWSALGLWSVTALALYALSYDLSDRLDILALVFPLGMVLAYLNLLIVAVVKSVRPRPNLASFPYLAAVIAAGLLAWFAGPVAGQRLRFHVLKPRYEAIVAGRSAPARGEIVVDPGLPRRVAFPWPGGLLDNWCGVVYDPTGLVMKARRFKPDWSNWNDPSLQDARRLFGGDLRRCEPLGGPWYFCCFT